MSLPDSTEWSPIATYKRKKSNFLRWVLTFKPLCKAGKVSKIVKILEINLLIN